jgi:hypothetical protein
MEITRIQPPKFRVGKHLLNEYELRTLMLEVAQGKKPAGIKVKCSQGNISIIRKDGVLTENLTGFSLAAELTIQMLTL